MQNTKPSKIWINGKKPIVGDVARSKDVGRSGRAFHVWDACPVCSVERWVKLNTKGTLCKSCAVKKSVTGDKNGRWKGGKRFAKNGIFLTVSPNHEFISMAHKIGKVYQIAEHRLFVAQRLGRCLKPGEVVHHINRNNYDNRIENLLLLPDGTRHLSFTLLQTQVDKLKSRVDQLNACVIRLEAENILLRSQLDVIGYDNPVLSEDDNGLL